MPELSIIQKTYDLIKWYIPILNRLPRQHKYHLGSRTIDTLYNLLEGLLKAKYSKQKQTQLEAINISLDILRYQTRLLFDFSQLSTERYEHVSKLITEIGCELGGWLKQLTNTHEALRKPLLANHQL
ncbi:diversity-generating retroelement protein Avd [Pseudanabaena minima]|uniref:diversity-generating retroelement protein Avd n=1 Tax=Pseudanabaena minima TaxID=890415 RepID=UPI003DA9E9D3